MKRARIAIVVSHPIQHFCPMYASLATRKDWETFVFFGSTAGAEPYIDGDFGREVSWSLPLDAFEHVFLNSSPMAPTAELDAPALDEALKKYRPDVVVVYGYFQSLQRRARRVASSLGARVYYISDTYFDPSMPRWKSMLKPLALRHTFSQIDRVLTVGNANEMFYAQCGVDRLRMTRMHFPIDVAAYETAWTQRSSRRRKIRNALGILPNDFVVISVGKLIDRKRQEDLLTAAIEHNGRFKVVIVGSGPDEQRLRKLADQAPDQVRLAGFISPIELPNYYLASDAYAHVSDFEPHSLAITEATYMGLPVVVSRNNGSYGPTDDLQPGRNGFVVPTGEPKALAQTINRIVSSPDLAKQMGASSREFALRAQARAHGDFMAEALLADGLL